MLPSVLFNTTLYVVFDSETIKLIQKINPQKLYLSLYYIYIFIYVYILYIYVCM